MREAEEQEMDMDSAVKYAGQRPGTGASFKGALRGLVHLWRTLTWLYWVTGQDVTQDIGRAADQCCTFCPFFCFLCDIISSHPV